MSTSWPSPDPEPHAAAAPTAESSALPAVLPDLLPDRLPELSADGATGAPRHAFAAAHDDRLPAVLQATSTAFELVPFDEAFAPAPSLAPEPLGRDGFTALVDHPLPDVTFADPYALGDSIGFEAGADAPPFDTLAFNGPAFDAPASFDSPAFDSPAAFDPPTAGPISGGAVDGRSLPTRWDSVDQDVAPSAFRNVGAVEAFGPAGHPDAFSAVHTDDGFHSASPVDAVGFADTAAHDPNFGDAFGAPLPTLPTTLIEDLQRIARRLVGRENVAVAIARDALAASIVPGHPSGNTFVAVSATVSACLDRPVIDDAGVPYLQHRARLRRDLWRHDERQRAVLALRHIVGVPPSAVAARLEIPESQVREVTSTWWPDDSRVDSLAMLRGIDSWISSDLGDDATVVGSHDLSHLDEVLA